MPSSKSPLRPQTGATSLVSHFRRRYRISQLNCWFSTLCSITSKSHNRRINLYGRFYYNRELWCCTPTIHSNSRLHFQEICDLGELSFSPKFETKVTNGLLIISLFNFSYYMLVGKFLLIQKNYECWILKTLGTSL